ncbi:hypothetical protein SDC9_124861 [bioreactor metagenome]|uniref:Uncharacterized protein n=1 Tax=bioreactor metagenome TaxID=1076179 RepID=A0A645CLM8_9ZZZZ
MADGDPNPAVRPIGGKRQGDAETIGFRRDAGTPEMNFRHRFQPDRLPDAGSPGIAAQIVFPPVGLLAPRPVAVAQGPGPHGQFEAFRPVAAEINGERGEAAAVTGLLRAVDPDGGIVIDRLKMEQQPLSPPRGRHPDFAPVPYYIHEISMSDPGKGGFRAERHGDLLRKSDGGARFPIFMIDGKQPGAVQIEPGVADP